ncbi:PadR family transcriptional regulator [Streptomyces sp. C10-9-1]|uniref:PadR family transcriptional regulator n=1 Tax=Streptomyces sp. C10-9-1 TaxID=1859285 RepID=UPI003D71933D
MIAAFLGGLLAAALTYAALAIVQCRPRPQQDGPHLRKAERRVLLHLLRTASSTPQHGLSIRQGTGLSIATVYVALDRLTARGLTTTYRRTEPEGRVRVFHDLTPAGHDQAVRLDTQEPPCGPRIPGGAP